FASADGEGTIKLWDERTGRELRTYRGHSSTISGLVFSPDGRWFATANWDRSARIWDATMTAREWHGPEARKLVQARFEKLLLRGDVLASLRDDQNIADEVRPVALELAQEWEEDPNVIFNFGLGLIRRPGGKAEDYARALRGYEFASRLVPGHEHYLYGLGTAQYRTG